jgi:U3 small nucleolar RNA-associated protein 4
MHSHDVRALISWPPYTPLPSSHKRQFPIDISPILVSGGLDMSVVLTPATLPTSTVVKVTNPLCTSTDPTFEVSYHRRLAYACGPSSTLAVQVARQARLLTCMRDTGLTLWRILRKRSAPDELSADNVIQESTAEEGWERVLDMELNVHTNLIASAISDDGRWLVMSDLYEAKLFKLESNVSSLLHPSLPTELHPHYRLILRSNRVEYEIFLPSCNLISQVQSQLEDLPSDLLQIRRN